MSGLYAHPELGRGPKYGFKPDSHLSGHPALPFEEVIQRRLKELATFLRQRPIDRELWIVEPGRVRIHERN